MFATALVPLFSLALLACTAEDDGTTFGSGGGSGTTSDGGAADDTGGSSADPDAPVITSIEAEFYNPPQLPTVIQVYVNYDDPQDDVWEGQVQFDIVPSEDDAYGTTLDIDGKYARLDDDIEGDPVTFWICAGEDCNSSVDTSQSYELSIELKDAAGHWSDPASTTVQ